MEDKARGVNFDGIGSMLGFVIYMESDSGGRIEEAVDLAFKRGGDEVGFGALERLQEAHRRGLIHRGVGGEELRKKEW